MEIERLYKELKEIKQEIQEKKNSSLNLWTPVIIALVGFFGSIFGYFFTEYSKNQILDKQTEYNFISEAIDKAHTGREKINKLMFLANSGLIPQNENIILSKLKSAVITPNDELVFLDSDSERLGSDNLYKLGLDLNENKNYFDAIKVLKKAIELDSTNYWAYISMSYSFLQLDKYEEVISICKDAVKIDNSNRYNAFYNIAVAYNNLDNKKLECKYWNLCISETRNLDSETVENIKRKISSRCDISNE